MAWPHKRRSTAHAHAGCRLALLARRIIALIRERWRWPDTLSSKCTSPCHTSSQHLTGAPFRGAIVPSRLRRCAQLFQYFMNAARCIFVPEDWIFVLELDSRRLRGQAAPEAYCRAAHSPCGDSAVSSTGPGCRGAFSHLRAASSISESSRSSLPMTVVMLPRYRL